MFTGIIENTGRLQAISQIGGDVRLTIHAPKMDFSDVKLGDSIASNGICLTVVAIDGDSYAVDVSRETLSKTALQGWQVGDTLNLEKAMLPTTRFGGHIVAGHVDGVGKIAKIAKDARSVYIEVQIPSELMKYTADKGSITVDGISLTTNAIKPDENIVCLNIIPHTAEMTNIARHWQVGKAVNIEVDLVARYLERLLLSRVNDEQTAPKNTISEQFLAQNGFYL
ncbi:riboflavin synthase [Moraxella caviae]|uniref:Riboflavin synthase n=1 Tax=Moraxella caviae TaxID=34060 RepID=A0A1S9ZXN9_9GAMM|nr:riboflavin synthase [Moraxella caviae]OOR88168.1 riboflavin synthase [Moraxella caviae]STZ10522.1 Riboflavin synthase alpha chain [Moraxella caviae]